MGRGRPKFQGDAADALAAERSIWAMVEMMRDRQMTGRPRASARDACKRLAARVGMPRRYGAVVNGVLVPDNSIETGASGERLRGLYKQAQSRMKADAAFAREAEQTLSDLRERRAERGWGEHPLDLLQHL